MPSVKKPLSVCLPAVLLLAMSGSASAQDRPTLLAGTRAVPADLRAWDFQVDSMIRNRELRLRTIDRDTLMPDRQHERFEQFYRSVRIVGGDVTRQTAPDGTISMFGVLHGDLSVDVAPAISSSDAAQR